jgi:hypothetical protein
MIISDLQHIESATKTKVQGGIMPGGCYQPFPVPCKPSYNVASANAGAEAFGINTKSATSTGTTVIQGKYSGSGSSSFSEAS